jgi:integrase
MKRRLTHNAINGLKPGVKPYWVTDELCANLQLYVGTSGKKVWYVHYRDKANKWKYEKLGDAGVMNAAEAREAATSFKAGILQGEYPSTKKPDTLTLGELIEGHYAPYAMTHKKTGVETLAILRAQFEQLYPSVVAGLAVADLEKWRSSRKLEGKKSASLNRYRTALLSALNWAAGDGLIEANPLSRWKPLKETDSDPIVRSLSDDERTRLYAALEEREKRLLASTPRAVASRAFADHLKPIVILSLNTAVRRGSILSLTWGDIDFENGIITVRAANAKNSKTQRVRMNKTAYDILEKWRKQSVDTSSAALVFPSPKTGREMYQCRHGWDNLKKSAHIENFRWHDMRHDVATRLRRKGVPLDVVQSNLGHASVKTTQRYAHIGPDEERAAMELLDEDSTPLLPSKRRSGAS